MSANPALISSQLQEAVAHHRAGRLNEAERLYRRVLQSIPDQPDALRLMAGLALQTGRHSMAETMAQKGLRKRPDNAELHRLLATALLERGRGESAAQSARRALELEPQSSAARLLLANALHAIGDVDDAEREWRTILRSHPDDVATLYNLAQRLLKKGHNPEARELLERAIARAPHHAGALALLAEFLVYVQPSQAAAMLNRAIEFGNRTAPVYLALGRALQGQRDYIGARTAFEQALRLDKANVDALIELGELWRQSDQIDKALDHLQRARATDPKNVEAILKLSDVLDLAWRNDEALQLLKANATLESRIGGGYCYRTNLSADIGAAERFAAHRDYARRFIAAPVRPPSSFTNARDPDRRLRIGYVSGDFKRHAVAFFALPLLRAHDPSQIDLFAYSDVAEPDQVTQAFRALPLSWRDIAGLGDDAAEAVIRQDGIDVLVDLAGLTTPNRLALFARRVAPLQITYLGYPNTTAIAAMDYRIVDDITDPPGASEQFNTEQLLRLPNGFLAYETPRLAPDPGALPALASGAVMFGSGNNLAKVDKVTLATWARLLKAVPTARLKLKDRRMSIQPVRHRVHAAFAALGIDPDRIVIEAFSSGPAGQFEFYQNVDIALDSFPYNGTTTTFETLWMGVPVITLAGDSHAGRVGMDILHRIGAPELVASDLDQYVAIATALAADLPRLAALRSSLRARLTASPLCDGARLAREFEAAYRQVWQRWCHQDLDRPAP